MGAVVGKGCTSEGKASSRRHAVRTGVFEYNKALCLQEISRLRGHRRNQEDEISGRADKNRNPEQGYQAGIWRDSRDRIFHPDIPTDLRGERAAFKGTKHIQGSAQAPSEGINRL
ncbi:MAG: hypothetical protein DDT31_01717 [Syntrophomonadaceae bacterium]|nr:hypothetical protein [Bacillota bacterium]